MPIHDWTRVDAGIFHHFHLEWIGEISRVLNRGLLPPDHYALAKQIAGPLASWEAVPAFWRCVDGSRYAVITEGECTDFA
jgi:hypothetical protein